VARKIQRLQENRHVEAACDRGSRQEIDRQLAVMTAVEHDLQVARTADADRARIRAARKFVSGRP
jgi:hypothetical protein